MPSPLHSKTAVVTGGSRGIGAAIAKRLAQDGANVAFTYLQNDNAAEQTKKAVENYGVQCTAAKADAHRSDAMIGFANDVIGEYGAIDILVHSAAISDFDTIESMSFERYRKSFAVNVDAVYASTHAFAEHMNDGGRIVLIGSVNAHSMRVTGGSVYGATKAALAAFARGWARDLGSRNILVNAVHPGPVNTDMNPADGPHAQTTAQMTAIGRYGEPEEIANLVGFLASDQASFITGASIDIDGGMSI